VSDTLIPRPAVLEPRWWSGTPAIDPAGYQIAADGYDLTAEAARSDGELAERMRSTFDRIGLVHLTGTGLTDHSEMRALAKLVLDAEMPYRAGANPRGVIAPNVYEVGAPLTAWLHYHHEMAYVGTSTQAIGFLCKQAVPGRGATLVADNVRATEAVLETELGRKLVDLGVCYRRDLTDRTAFEGREPIGVYNHWQRSLGTDDANEAEARAHDQGLTTSWGPDGLLHTRYYTSAFEYAPAVDRNLLYCSVADHYLWFDAWPLVEQLPPSQRPLWMTFGDDTDFTIDELRTFIDVYDRYGSPIDWRVGDVAVICNYRFAHGRPAIHLAPGEQRELGVLLGGSFPRIGAVPGKW
jgi:hypothetical protein